MSDPHNALFSFVARSCCYFLVPLLFIVSSETAIAHVSADSMPDSVAEVEYSIYLEFKPNDLQIRNKLGMVFYRMNKLDEAYREFSLILKKEPDNYDALDGMGLVKAAQQQYDEALKLHQRALDLNPNDMMVYYHLGNVLEKKGRLQEAADAYHMALKKFAEQYPAGTDNKNALEFQEKVKAAISEIEIKL